LAYDIILDDAAFNTASEQMAVLKTRTEALRTKLETMYHNVTTALDTPAGQALEITAKDVLIEPIDKMLVVIEHVSSTLNEIIGEGHYKDVFVKFEELNQSVNFN